MFHLRRSRGFGSILSVLLIVFLCCTSVWAADGGLLVESPYGLTNDSFGVASFLEQNRYSAASFQAEAELLPEQMVQTAQDSLQYKLVSGDAFSLTYYSGNSLITNTYRVDGNLKVSIPEFGEFDCSDLSFVQLKAMIQESITQLLPYSSPRMDMISCGLFQVVVTGEVNSNVPVRGWGGSTLKNTMGNASPFASSRDVVITHMDGTVEHFDLYKALSEGDESNNPTLRPGDRVTYQKAGRIVTLSGAVFNPGTYQLLSGEGLSDLVNNYGHGLLPSADGTAIAVESFENGVYSASDYSVSDRVDLKNFDKVCVLESTGFAYISVEGAISTTQTAADNAAALTSANKLLYGFKPGEKASQLLNAVSYAFIPASDLQNIYLIRGSERIILESGKLLAGQAAEDPVLQAGDRLIVPFAQTFVTVNGSVNNSGRVAYVPDKDASYYIGLSGGYSSTAAAVGRYQVYDAQGEKLDRKGVIPNGAIITVDTNNFARDISVVASVATLVSTVVIIANYIIGWTK